MNADDTPHLGLAAAIRDALRVFKPPPAVPRHEPEVANAATPITAPAAGPEPTAVDRLTALLAEVVADLAEQRAAYPVGPTFAPHGYWPIAVVARRVGYSSETVRLWCVAGLIEAVRRGAKWHASLASVEAFVRTMKAPR
jgi:hypothetical protein